MIPVVSEVVRYRRHRYLPVVLVPVVSHGPTGLSLSLWSLTASVVSEGVRYRGRHHQLPLVLVPVVPYDLCGL